MATVIALNNFSQEKDFVEVYSSGITHIGRSGGFEKTLVVVKRGDKTGRMLRHTGFVYTLDTKQIPKGTGDPVRITTLRKLVKDLVGVEKRPSYRDVRLCWIEGPSVWVEKYLHTTIL